jgi:hypothetical protein
LVDCRNRRLQRRRLQRLFLARYKRTAVWLMNGAATVRGSAGLGNVPTTWTVQGNNVD